MFCKLYWFLALLWRLSACEEQHGLLKHKVLQNKKAGSLNLLAHDGGRLRMEAVVSHTDSKLIITLRTFTRYGRRNVTTLCTSRHGSVYSRQHFTMWVKLNKSNQKQQMMNYLKIVMQELQYYWAEKKCCKCKIYIYMCMYLLLPK